MLEFIRVLSDDEVELLKSVDMLHLSGRNRNLGRWEGKNLKSIVARLESCARQNAFFFEGQKEYLISALTIARYCEDIFNNKSTSLNIDLVNKFAESEAPCSFYTYENDVRSIKNLGNYIIHYLSENSESGKSKDDAAIIRKSIRKMQNPTYCWLGPKLKWPDEKVERIARGLHGIISIETGYGGQYTNLSIPAYVYDNLVMPALKDNKHRFAVKVEDINLLKILDYLYHRSKELRANYGSNLRPEFYQKEICNKTNLEPKSSNEFSDLMKGLEGILARITKNKKFYPETKNKKRYCMSVEYFTWFLPLKHQRLLEADYSNQQYVDKLRSNLFYSENQPLI